LITALMLQLYIHAAVGRRALVDLNDNDRSFQSIAS